MKKNVRQKSNSVLCLTLIAAALLPTTGVAEWKEIYSWTAGQSFANAPFRFEKGFLRNKEKQYYVDTADVFQVTKAGLVLRGIKKPRMNDAYVAGDKDWRLSKLRAQYQSVSLHSKSPYRNFAFEVKAAIIDGTGAWPAIWLRGVNKDRYGEVDLIEQVGYRPEKIHTSIHLGTSGDNRTSLMTSRVIKGFLGRTVTYRAEMTPDTARVIIDGREAISSSRTVVYQGTKPLDQGFHPVMNIALGGSWGGKIDDNKLPAVMTISAITLWEWVPDPVSSTTPSASSPE